MTIKLILLAIFGIAMAHLEGVVVVYLRKALGMLRNRIQQRVNRKIPETLSEY